MNISGIRNVSSGQLRHLSGTVQRAASQGIDTRLQRSLVPPSEKDNYSENDALLNQYMKQYRIDAKIEGDTFTIKDGEKICLILPDQITQGKLEEFRKTLSSNVNQKDIDWVGLKNDFGQMSINFDNAENLNGKIDYITSRYAIVKDQIEKNWDGEDKENQLKNLNEIFENAKKTIADSFTKTIGGFYDEFGAEGVSSQMKEDILSGIDERAGMYGAYIDKNQTSLKSNVEDWLLNDDAYMAGLLRNAAKEETTHTSSQYSLKDLGVASIFAKESMQQLDSIRDGIWPDDEQSIGLDLAIQGMKTEHLIKNTGVSGKIADVIRNSFGNYMNKYLDRVDEVMGDIAKNSMVSGMKQKLDRETVMDIYDKALGQYHATGNIEETFMKQAQEAQKSYQIGFAKQGGSYADKFKWDSFFKQEYEGNSFSFGTSTAQKYQDNINKFVSSLENNNIKNIVLGFTQSSQIASGLEKSTVYTYA